MREILHKQMRIGEVDIKDIQFDLKARDEITKLLMGLQYIYATDDLRRQAFAILSELTPRGIDSENGRPGMDYWKILVLGALRLACNIDYDNLKNLADNHRELRLIMGDSALERDSYYALQTIKDNVSLLTPDVLGRVSQLVVKHGHKLSGASERDAFYARCDSFVVETNVHYPTDINLLLDATRKVITLMAVVCSEAGITDWRQSGHGKRKVKKLYRKAQRSKRLTSKNPKKVEEKERAIKEAYLAYLGLCVDFLTKAEKTIKSLKVDTPAQMARILAIERYMSHAWRQIDQVHRRVIEDDTVPHEEKVFSIFEEHTEWITKGKAGVPQELGLNVCVVEDQYGFIIHHQVMRNQVDKDVTVPIAREAKSLYPTLAGCSFDKGFWSPDNFRELDQLLERVTLPKKGKPTKKESERQNADAFILERKRHAAVESAINALENHGLDRCPDRGLDAFSRYVALAVVSRNIQILGDIERQKKAKREKRREKHRATRDRNQTKPKPFNQAA
jgi:IS5 family transposase